MLPGLLQTLPVFPAHDCWGDLSGCDDGEPQKSLQKFIYRCYSHVRGRRFGSLTWKDKKYISYLGATPHPVTVTTWITVHSRGSYINLCFLPLGSGSKSYHAVWGNEKFMSKSTSESKTLGPADLNNSQGASLRFKVKNMSMPLTSELSNPTNERFDALCT